MCHVQMSLCSDCPLGPFNTAFGISDSPEIDNCCNGISIVPLVDVSSGTGLFFRFRQAHSDGIDL